MGALLHALLVGAALVVGVAVAALVCCIVYGYVLLALARRRIRRADAVLERTARMDSGARRDGASAPALYALPADDARMDVEEG